MQRGIVFSIKRYAIHDGPGIRTTVFFKGCPLNCVWCHNPEGIHPEPEVLWDEKKCPEECHFCIRACSENAVIKQKGKVSIKKSQCRDLKECEEACVYEALRIAGRRVSVKGIMEDILKDEIFWDESGGGVTFSGGEPLMQPDFLNALLRECKEGSIHTIVDTSGYAPYEVFENIMDKVDVFYYDLKILDDDLHRKFTGVSNVLILENLKKLTGKGKSVVIRIPLIEGFNSDERNIRKAGEFLRRFSPVESVHILPYHSAWKEKFRKLRQMPPKQDFQAVPAESIEQTKAIISNLGFSVSIGG